MEWYSSTHFFGISDSYTYDADDRVIRRLTQAGNSKDRPRNAQWREAPIIWQWLTAFFAPASPVRSAELGSWSNGRSDPEPSMGSSGQPVARQNAGKSLSLKTARLACLNYLPPSSSAVTSIGLNCGIRDCGFDALAMAIVGYSFFLMFAVRCPACRWRFGMGDKCMNCGLPRHGGDA